MFPTTLPALILWNLCALLGVLTLIWVVNVMRLKYQERKSRQQRFCCVICGTSYYDDSKLALVECPRCGRFNERGMVSEI